MYKSVIIVLSIVWLICVMYLTIARLNGYPFSGYAMAGSWMASILLLAFIILYLKKHRKSADT